jgi:hypothetical protein
MKRATSITPPAEFDAHSKRLVQHHRDQARMAQLETALAQCLHYIAELNGVPHEEPEPECTTNAKKLLGWRLG